MRVKLKTVMCGPSGNFGVGQVGDFDDAQARALIDGGYAEAVDKPQAGATVLATETAAIAAPVTAAAPHKRGKRGYAA